MRDIWRLIKVMVGMMVRLMRCRSTSHSCSNFRTKARVSNLKTSHFLLLIRLVPSIHFIAFLCAVVGFRTGNQSNTNFRLLVDRVEIYQMITVVPTSCLLELKQGQACNRSIPVLARSCFTCLHGQSHYAIIMAVAFDSWPGTLSWPSALYMAVLALSCFSTVLILDCRKFHKCSFTITDHPTDKPSSQEDVIDEEVRKCSIHRVEIAETDL